VWSTGGCTHVTVFRITQTSSWRSAVPEPRADLLLYLLVTRARPVRGLPTMGQVVCLLLRPPTSSPFPVFLLLSALPPRVDRLCCASLANAAGFSWILLASAARASRVSTSTEMERPRPSLGYMRLHEIVFSPSDRCGQGSGQADAPRPTFVQQPPNDQSKP